MPSGELNTQYSTYALMQLFYVGTQYPNYKCSAAFIMKSRWGPNVQVAEL